MLHAKMINKNKILSEEETVEIVLDNKKIDELISRLEKLKEEKSHIHFEINKNQHMLIHHESDELL
jgi:hypothetical protein